MLIEFMNKILSQLCIVIHEVINPFLQTIWGLAFFYSAKGLVANGGTSKFPVSSLFI
jgi:hypothetical protein